MSIWEMVGVAWFGASLFAALVLCALFHGAEVMDVPRGPSHR